MPFHHVTYQTQITREEIEERRGNITPTHRPIRRNAKSYSLSNLSLLMQQSLYRLLIGLRRYKMRNLIKGFFGLLFVLGYIALVMLPTLVIIHFVLKYW